MGVGRKRPDEESFLTIFLFSTKEKLIMRFRLKRCDYWPMLLPCGLAIALVATLWGVTLYQLDVSRKSHLVIASKDAESFAIALQVRTERAIEIIDQSMVFMRYAYDEQGASLNLGELMADGVMHADALKRYSVLDRNANVLLSSAPSEAGNLSGSEDVLVHAAQGSDKLWIGKPVAGIGGGQWAIRMTRRLNRHDGAFNGTAMAVIDSAYFSRIYDSVDLGMRGSISLVGGDGVIRARRTAINDVIGKNVSDSEVFKALLKNGDGALRALSVIDGVDRFWAYRKLENQLLYVVVGVSVEDRLVSYTAMRSQMLGLAGFSTLVIVLSAGLLLLFIRRLCMGRARAEDENLKKTVFLSNMSHELRTPLNGILGYSELLTEDLRNPEKRLFAQYIYDSGTHLLGLVNSLLQISKIEAGQVTLDLKRESLDALLAAAINAHASFASGKGLVLSLVKGAGLPVDVVCDRMRVMQVLNNLLHNAIKFTSAGKVELTVDLDPQGLCFSVLDSGPGIEPEFASVIFDSFFQVRQNSMEGTGLGLAIAKQLVQLMGGSIWLSSTQGHGATFFFTLPLKS
jgi:signal transduction histidine kinase